MNGTIQPDGSKPHEWERLDQGEAYCIHCPATNIWGVAECMSDARDIIKAVEPRVVIAQPKPAPRVTVRENVHAEIQHIQRIINGANKRLERLCEQIAEK